MDIPSFNISDHYASPKNLERTRTKRKRVSTISTELAETSAVQSAKKLSSNVLQNSEQNHEEKQVPKKLKSEKFFENVLTWKYLTILTWQF